MIKSSGLLLILILLFGRANGQGYFIKGKLVDSSTSLPLQNISVTVYSNAKSIYLTSSDSAGNFRIAKNLIGEINHIKASSLNYADLRFTIPPGKYNKSNGDIDLGVFRLSPQKIALKEVIVRSKRYSDTATIDLSKKTSTGR